MKLLTLKDVRVMTQLSQSSIYKFISLGQFPKPLKIGATSRWVEDEVYQYLQNLSESR
ncbi:AlpA family transcriptional regulator [Vibrio parahaemolyticus]|uniref:helix-turn-helix transcriptional regulator n=1 Tax=Vibrio parahaemolyticus TaxID=670 RepID=UPI001122B3BF|nr:AlpA family phage regulatory protein [Vibrio parahaemolyticus]TOH58838.1 AlpA family transcriptional regulator [Vibrio parahaemolyticus]